MSYLIRSYPSQADLKPFRGRCGQVSSRGWRIVGRGLRIAVLSLLIAVCLHPPCRAAEPIRIGVSLGLTGRFAVMAAALNNGFRLWEKNINEKGGILGCSVRVIVRDDRSDPESAVAIYRDLVQKERVDFLFAPYSSLITDAVLPVADAHDIPMLIAGAAADRLWEQGYRNAVGIYTPASKFALGFLELLVLNDLDRVVLVHADDPFSVDLATHIQKWAPRFALKILDVTPFRKGTPDLTSAALNAREKQAQVLMVCGHMDESVNMVKALKRIDWRPDALYASVGPALQGFFDRSGPDSEHVFATSLWEPRANYPGARQFNQAYIDAYHEAPGYHAGLAYAAGQVLEKAVNEVGSIDRKKVRNALFSLDTMTIIGRFGVDKTGKQVRQHTFIIQWQNGIKELVWPDQIKTAEPIFR
jgi:branched-chain amino acid transport system substrate-binding protein